MALTQLNFQAASLRGRKTGKEMGSDINEVVEGS
jgi:hypothetical protein